MTIDPATGTGRPSRRLKIVKARQLTVRRRRAGRGFQYLDADGRRITDRGFLERVAALAIPPAYRDVRIAADERAHLQAVGYDEAGRIQHRYHPEWEAVRERRKAGRLARLVAVLPRLRAAVARDLASPRLTRDKALAGIVALIDETHLRVGCEAYARENGSHGAATLRRDHVRIRGEEVALVFTGKGGKEIACAVRRPALARAMRRMQTLPGERAFMFAGPDGPRPVTSADVNAYLRRIAGVPVTAKDFRGLAASSGAAEELVAIEPAPSQSGRKRQLAQVMRRISTLLANTPAVVRKSYVHPAVVKGFLTGKLKRAYRAARGRRGRLRIESAIGHLVGPA